MRSLVSIVVALAALAVVAREPERVEVKVVSVHDGDTLRALDPGKVERRVRLLGIDAPELGQPHGRVARDRLREQVLGQSVLLEVAGRDRFGRDLATVVADGESINRQLVAEGLAWHYVRSSDDPGLAAAQAEAQAARRGLWADAAPIAPWEWRASESERRRRAKVGGAPRR